MQNYLDKPFFWALLLLISFLRADELSIDHAIVSYYVVDLESGKVKACKNSDLSMIPASCMKIVTTAAALHLLGAGERFATHLEYDGRLDSSVLHGNIYIRGEGDPTLGSLDWKKTIDEFAEAILALGIHKIEGKIIADASLWETAQAIPSWSWEDLGNYYGAGASALSFHDNSYSLTLKPGKTVGDKAEILRLDPPIKGIELCNEATTGPVGSGDGICIYGSEYSPLRFVRGTVPLGPAEFTVKGSIPDPAASLADLLAQELLRRGIMIENREIAGKRTLFHTTHSPPLGDIVHQINQKSVNLYAEHLIKKMGGADAVTDFWRTQGVPLSGFHMADGSGLSRKNLVTAKQLVAILLKMKDSSPFLNSLPEREGGVRAKSGSMSQIKAFAGYGDGYAFAVIVNHCLDRQKLGDLLSLFMKSIRVPDTLNAAMLH